jgi:hypothetical protein
MKPRYLFFVLLTICLTACNGKGLFQPAETPTPTPTLTSTPTITPTVTLTPTITLTHRPLPTIDHLAQYLSLLPQIPEGYQWRMAADMDVIMLLPDGWFFSREFCPVMNVFGEVVVEISDVAQACISEQDPQQVGKYSVGQAAIVYSKIDDPEAFATHLLRTLSNSPNFGLVMASEPEKTKELLEKFPPDIYMRDIHTPTKILKAWDYKTDQYTVHHLRIEAEYKNESGDNRNKIVQYSASLGRNQVILVITEAPANVWDEFMKKHSLVLDYVIHLKK